MKAKTIIIIFAVALVAIGIGTGIYLIWMNFQKTNQNLLNPNGPTLAPIENVTKPKLDIKITSKVYPNGNLTPGFILTMDTDFICNHKYYEIYRNVSDDVKRQVFENYHLSYPPKTQYQVDRLIPFELGGSPDIRNLWPQGSSPYPGSAEKDKVETYLRNQVCNNTMNLSIAQEAIRKDWIKVYQECCAK